LIHREAALVGPAFLERLAARRSVPVVYDVDDPVFLPYRSPMNGWFSLLKFPRKTHSLFRLSDHVITINNLLAEYAAHYNRSVTVIPNCVDLDRYRCVRRHERDFMRLVWIGSHSTMSNLAAVQEPIRRLQAAHRAPLCLIGAGEPDLPGIDLEVRQWSAATEVQNLQEGDVGLVPLPDYPWNRWKFFFKTIQYMAAGLPVVGHRMGSNSEVIRHGINGFLADTPDEWHSHLLTLARDPALRRRMGEAARNDVEERYSLQTQIPRLASIFDRVVTQCSG
jgi:glycosyltransferase involved in cell wall biosynthesis